ncbi:MAG: restriction endonuclease subunit S, partial [Candidatus Eremiobacteraeota bacterium]|nr:restriction endonuclease subunit S [Candidatus Eremiobacteraeota bacterium]
MDATESLHESIQQNLGQDLPPIPKHWSWATADQVCLNKISSGGTPTGRMTQDGQVPFLKVYNLTFTGELDFTREPTFIDFETHEKVLKKSRLLPGDVLMNIVGPPLGKVSIVPDDYPEWNMNQAIVFFRTSHLYSNKLLCLWLRGEFAKKFFGQEAKATAGQYNVRTSKCRQLPIPVPPADEQRRIVARIEELTARSKTAKQALQAIPPLLEKFRQSVLAAAFRGDLTADWRLKNVGTPSADTFLAGVREELARNRLDKSQAKRSNDDRQLLGPAGSPALPTGWAWAKLEDITYNLDGRRIPLVASERAKRRGPYPYYGASGVIDGLNDFIFEGPHLLVAEDG